MVERALLAQEGRTEFAMSLRTLPILLIAPEMPSNIQLKAAMILVTTDTTKSMRLIKQLIKYPMVFMMTVNAAIALLVANIAMMVAPFVAAAAAAAPFVAIAIALGGGLYYLYTQGVTVASVMEFMGVNTEKAGELFSDFGAMISEVGDLLVNLLRVSEPVFATSKAKAGIAIERITVPSVISPTWNSTGIQVLKASAIPLLETVDAKLVKILPKYWKVSVRSRASAI